MIGMLLPLAAGGAPLAVGIGGLSRTIRGQCERLIAIMREAIARHFVEPARTTPAGAPGHPGGRRAPGKSNTTLSSTEVS